MSKEQALEILKRTRKLLEDPKRWCGGRWARDSQGNGCQPNDPHAACWCLEGGLRKVTNEHYVSVIAAQRTGYIEAVNALREQCLTKTNDWLYAHEDHAALLRLIDNGIARLSGKRLRLS